MATTTITETIENFAQPVHSNVFSPSLTNKIEAIARETPGRTFSTIITKDGSIQDISYRHFSNVINTAATWMDQNLPQHSSPSDFPTFLYVGDVNLRILALLVAGAKTGRKMLLVRRYALPEVLSHLVDETDCQTFLYESSDEQLESSKDPHFGDRDAVRVTLPAWESWFTSPESTTYVPMTTRKRTMDDPVCVFHTSGSTGKPKPIIYTDRKISCFTSIEYFSHQLNLRGARMLSSFPLIHAGGATTSLFWPIYLGHIPVIQETGVPNTAEDVDKVLQISGATLLAAQPSILSVMSTSESMTSRIRQQLSFILTGSAPLSSSIVDQLQENDGPYVMNMYGSTESLPLRQNLIGRDDWPYVSFKADSGVSFYHETDDLYEFVVEKNTESRHTMLSVFCTFPDQHVFRSKDLFIPHPSKPGLWRFACRKDDLLSLATGQGINVGPMELIVSECPFVDTAIVGLDGRRTTILLVVPHRGTVNGLRDSDQESKVDILWPYVERANKIAHPNAAIRKDMILLLPQKSAIESSTTDKGTVKRQVLFKRFQREIDEVYAAAEK